MDQNIIRSTCSTRQVIHVAKVSNPLKKKGNNSGKGGGGCRENGFATYFTTRNGRRIYASDYGYKAWPIGKR